MLKKIRFQYSPASFSIKWRIAAVLVFFFILLLIFCLALFLEKKETKGEEIAIRKGYVPVFSLFRQNASKQESLNAGLND